MKKASAAITAIGAIATIALIVLIIRFGNVNMRRVSAEAAEWRMSWADRR